MNARSVYVSACLFLSLCTGQARAGNDTLLVTDGGLAAVFQVAPATGNRAVVSGLGIGSGPPLVIPRAAEADDSGNVFVAERAGSVLRIDPATGNRTVVTSETVGSGPTLLTLEDLLLDENGDVFVLDSGLDAILRVDPVSGARTVVSGAGIGTGPVFVKPTDFIVDAAGDFIICDESLRSVLRVDAATGERAFISAPGVGNGPLFTLLAGIGIEADGDLLALDRSVNAALYRIDPTSGDREIVSSATTGSGPEFVAPSCVLVETSGEIVVVDALIPGLITVHPITGDRALLSSPSVGAGVDLFRPLDVSVRCGALCTDYFRDEDQDGYGVDGDSLCLCTPFGLYTASVPGDCDDSNPTVHPTALEVCNGIDDDCDSVIDSNCLFPGDDCSSAIPIFEGPNPHDSTGATASGIMATGLPPWVDNQTPDTACQDFIGLPGDLSLDIFYLFTPPANGAYLFSTCNTASYDTKLAIYSGTCSTPTALACNDDGDGCAGFSSELRATGLASSETYLLQVGAFGATVQGTATINVSRIAGTQNYCTSTGAMISSSGSTSIAADDFVIEATGLPDEFCLFQVATQSAFFPFGPGGTQCIFAPCRLNPPLLATGGSVSRAVPLADYVLLTCPAPTPGVMYFFQGFFRDGFGGADTTDGLAVAYAN